MGEYIDDQKEQQLPFGTEDRVEAPTGAVRIGKSVRPGNAGQLGLEEAMPS